jgi:hypothetical protein
MKGTLRTRDEWLLAAAGALGIVSTARFLGIDGVTLPAAALLGGAALLALGPLVRLWGDAESLKSREKAIVAVIFACHLVATLYFFPPEDVVNGRPVITLDHAVHFYEVERGKDVFRESFRSYMYDPYFLAGYPGGTVFEIDTNGVALWCALLRFVDTARSYKLFILLAYLCLPFAMYAGCRRLRFGVEESVFGTLVFLAYWHWGRPYAGDFRFAGMFAYLFVCHLSLYLTGLFRSFLEGERVKRLYVIGPLAFLVHPTAAVLLPVPLLALFAARGAPGISGGGRRERASRLLGRFFVWCLLVLAVNAFWLVPFFRYLHIKTASESFFQIDGIRGLLVLLIKPGNLPALLLVALGGIGIGCLAKRRRLADGIAPAAGSFFLMLLAAFGTRMPIIDQMEPGRFLVPSLVFMAPLAGAGLKEVVEKGGAALAVRSASLPSRSLVGIVLLACMPLFGMVESRAFYRHTLSTTLTPEVKQAIDAIRTHADPSGRLMIEDGPAWAYGDSHLPSMIPLFTGIEQIGGPYPFMFIEHGFTTFQTRMTMGVPLREMAPEKLLEYVDLYNVRWILTATPEAASYVRGLWYARALWSSKHFTLFGVTTPSRGFSSDPGATVRASYDLLRVTISSGAAAAPPGGILLKYHWDKGLRVAAPSRIVPSSRLEDPVPLILLEPNGKTDIRITFH